MRFYLSGKQAQVIDKYTQDVLGIPGIVLMEKAAEKLAENVDALIKSGDRLRDIKIISVVEGGNNGGDAVCAAWMLKEMGYDTYIYEINGISHKSPSYLTEIGKAAEKEVKFITPDLDLGDFDVIIDGIFGVGLTREVSGIQRKVIELINQAREKSGTKVIGTDIPSGISSDTGKILGAAVKCDLTITFEYIKYGMLINAGRTYSGDIRCESIGLFVPDSISQMSEILKKYQIEMIDNPDDKDGVRRNVESLYINYEFEKEEIFERLPARKPDSNKGTYGKVLVIAGSKDIYGAVYMAAEAAYRTGAGLVKVVTDIRNRDILCDKLPEAMILTYDTEKTESVFRKKKQPFDDTFIRGFTDSVKWADVVLAGPGLGTGDTSKTLITLLEETITFDKKLILDADALNILSMDGSQKLLESFVSMAGRGNVIITPHMMEMLRIVKSGYDKKTFDFMIDNLGCDSEMNCLKEFARSQAYSLSYFKGIITVLKDARTIISYRNQNDDKPGMEGYARECPIYINTTGNSGMSKGGSGDVLAGTIAGLLAQAKNCDIPLYEVVSAAVNLHGRAGDFARERLGERSMMARDIIDSISDVIK